MIDSNESSEELLKINLPKFRFIESLRHTAILKNLNFTPIQQEAKHDQEQISAEQK